MDVTHHFDGLEFEWDSEKAATNEDKHSVQFTEAATVFADPVARIFDDDARSETEVREIIVGYSLAQRLLLVSYTERSETIRLISARIATKKERKNHEQST